MTRAQLEHVIRAAGAIADDDDLIVVGSQAILQFPNAPEELRVSKEADVFPRNRIERSDMIDSTIGEGSPFQREFGYYAHGIAEETAVLPAGWRKRLVLVSGGNTRHVRGWCLEVHDLAISKHVAGPDNDIDFTEGLARHGMVSREILHDRLKQTPIDDAARARIAARIEAQFTSGTAPRFPS